MLKNASDYIVQQLSAMNSSTAVNSFFKDISPLQIPVDEDVPALVYNIGEIARPTKGPMREYRLTLTVVATSYYDAVTGADHVRSYIEQQHPRWRFENSTSNYINERSHSITNLNYTLKIE